MKPFVTTLLKADRSELPGGTFVNGHDSPDDRSLGQPIQVDGDWRDPNRTKSVSYLTQPIQVYVSTEEAKRYLESLKADDELAIENPFLGGTGRVHIIRPGVRPVVNTQVVTAFIDDTGEVRNVLGVCEFPAAQVVEEAELVSP